jgi:hypothetical protein
MFGLVLVLSAGGCARQPIENPKATGLDRKLSTFAWIEQGEIATLIVNTKPARDRDGSPYMPLEIAVANNGLQKLTLTRESFVLVDSLGNRYPMATPSELMGGYDLLDIDRNLAELEGIVFNKFAAYARYPSNWSPRTRPAASNVVIDLVVLPKFGYFIDFIYFPAPVTGIRDKRFELFMDSPDLADPVFVRFEVE